VERREAIRQEHFAAYERRRERRVEVRVNVGAVAAPKRSFVCRAPVSSGGSFSGGASYAPVSSVPVVADESCEEVEAVEPRSPRANMVFASTETHTEEPTAASVTTTYDTGASVTLQATAVTTQTVAAAPAMQVEAYPEWSTPETFSTARVAVTTEQVAAQPPACVRAPRPAPVTVVDATPALVLFNLFGAVLDAVVRAQPEHAAVPVSSGQVHVARPVAPPPSVATARPGVQPTPPAPR